MPSIKTSRLKWFFILYDLLGLFSLFLYLSCSRFLFWQHKLYLWERLVDFFLFFWYYGFICLKLNSFSWSSFFLPRTQEKKIRNYENFIRSHFLPKAVQLKVKFIFNLLWMMLLIHLKDFIPKPSRLNFSSNSLSLIYSLTSFKYIANGVRPL